MAIVISKCGRYWATGITLTYSQLAERINGVLFPGWHARLDFFDDGFADNDPDKGGVSTQGTLCTRYPVRDGDLVSGLSLAVDTLIADAGRLGIELSRRDGVPFLYYQDDGESENYPPPPGWRALLAAEAARIGWETYALEASRG
jgi:hypothetical protein